MKPTSKSKRNVATKATRRGRVPGPVREAHYVAYRTDTGAVVAVHTIWTEEDVDPADDSEFVMRLATDGGGKRGMNVLHTPTLPTGPSRVDDTKVKLVAEPSGKSKTLRPTHRPL